MKARDIPCNEDSVQSGKLIELSLIPGVFQVYLLFFFVCMQGDIFDTCILCILIVGLITN